ncbi:hypothetical protein SD10_07040 [Spirosoma radiotolerans]|uniref:Pyrrolo-quinoline quinone repeat domain-containing protein n=1 Tax=Spirosoma radiotolerans TaxID=1379870 RepID=A0A0E3V6N8_9BACT|nr:hypothetical protein SD10_07040 [Spirosoma radiotolerans]
MALTGCIHPVYTTSSHTVFISSDNGTLQALNAKTGKAKWQCKLGKVQVNAAPIVSDGLVIMTTSEEAAILAFDATTGSLKWKKALPDGLIFSARITDKTIYALATNKAFWDYSDKNFTTLYALDMSTGNLKWSFQTGSQPTWAALSNTDENCPLVCKGTVYFGGSDGLFYAINAEKGTIKWTYSAGVSFYSSPVCVDNVVYIGDANGSLLALDDSTGKLKWRVHDSYTIHAGIATDNKHLFVPYDGPASVAAYSLTDGSKRWLFTPSTFISSAPSVANGLLYLSSEDGMFYAIDTSSGLPKWKTRLLASQITVPTVVNNTIYVGGGRNMYALDASTGKQKWAFFAGGNVVKSACIQTQNGIVFRGLGAIQPQ